MIIHGQTIDQKFFRVLNLRTGGNGDVPCSSITLGMCDKNAFSLEILYNLLWQNVMIILGLFPPNPISRGATSYAGKGIRLSRTSLAERGLTSRLHFPYLLEQVKSSVQTPNHWRRTGQL